MTAYPFLKDNIDALRAQGQAIYQWLSTQNVDHEKLATNIFSNRWGMVDWKLSSGQGLFEAMPPQGIYGGWIPQEKADTSASFIVGCNLGYGINHLLTKTPDSHKVIVLEPDPHMLLACLGQTDYRPFFANKKLHFVVPDERYIQEVVRNLDLQFVYGNVLLRTDMPSQQLGPEYAQWGIRVKNRLENFTVEMVTLRYRQDMMVGNELKNFSRAVHDGSLRSLLGNAKGVAGVILGAGPSLAEYGPQLAKHQGYALYATALQTMPALQSYGLKPHFCMVLDYTDQMLKLYDRLDVEFARDVPLIYSTKANPDVVARYPGPTLPLWTMGGMATFAQKGQDLVLDAGGNVSLTLSRLLRLFGTSHILLVGQDFAWRGDHTHAAGHHYAAQKTEFNPRRHQYIKNLDGEQVVTSIQYMTAKRELEDDIKQSDTPYYLLYGGYAPIDGTVPVDLVKARKKGLFASAPGSVERFSGLMSMARNDVRGWHFVPRSPQWSAWFNAAEKRLAKLFKKIGANQDAIHNEFQQALGYIKHEAIYLPYLFNETMDMSGLTNARQRHEARDLSDYKKIVRSVLKKVREIDRTLSEALGQTRAA